MILDKDQEIKGLRCMLDILNASYVRLYQEKEQLAESYDELYKQAMQSASDYERWEKDMKQENQRFRQALETVKSITKKDGAWTTGAKSHYVAHRALEGLE